MRGYARLDTERFAHLPARDFPALAGKGALAITIEPRRGGNTYQGIVELSDAGIAASAETYFAQSEQLPTAIRPRRRAAVRGRRQAGPIGGRAG